MNKIFCALLLGVTGWLTACDEIAEGDRYLEMPAVESRRAVLLEEFTGQMCTNCPEAQRRISSMKEQYGDQLVVVGIHAGNFGLAESDYGSLGLMQPEGDEYATHWNIESYPAGVIDRTSGVLNAPDWAAYVRNEVTKEAKLGIGLSAVVTENEEGDSIVSVSATLEPSVAVNGKLQLWITESHIVGFQIDGGNTLTDYEHNHVYRASVNGTWGEDVALQENVFQTVERSIPVRENWNTANLSVVGFVYNDAEGVLQVAECEVEK